jgi:choline dehydrogenase-like flavoprotein
MTSVFGTIIIGAGQAGCSLAERLTKGGITVHRRKPDRGDYSQAGPCGFSHGLCLPRGQ